MNKLFTLNFLLISMVLSCCLNICIADETNKSVFSGSDIDFSNRQMIIEADEYLTKAMLALEQDDSEEAKINYHLFLDKINSVDIDNLSTKDIGFSS